LGGSITHGPRQNKPRFHKDFSGFASAWSPSYLVHIERAGRI